MELATPDAQFFEKTIQPLINNILSSIDTNDTLLFKQMLVKLVKAFKPFEFMTMQHSDIIKFSRQLIKELPKAFLQRHSYQLSEIVFGQIICCLNNQCFLGEKNDLATFIRLLTKTKLTTNTKMVTLMLLFAKFTDLYRSLVAASDSEPLKQYQPSLLDPYAFYEYANPFEAYTTTPNNLYLAHKLYQYRIQHQQPISSLILYRLMHMHNLIQCLSNILPSYIGLIRFSHKAPECDFYKLEIGSSINQTLATTLIEDIEAINSMPLEILKAQLTKATDPQYFNNLIQRIRTLKDDAVQNNIAFVRQHIANNYSLVSTEQYALFEYFIYAIPGHDIQPLRKDMQTKLQSWINRFTLEEIAHLRAIKHPFINPLSSASNLNITTVSLFDRTDQRQEATLPEITMSSCGPSHRYSEQL